MPALQVTLTGGAEHPAKIVGFDEDRDVAVLQLVIEDGELVSVAPLLCICTPHSITCLASADAAMLCCVAIHHR